MHFHNHMPETPQEQGARVFKKINAILKEEGMTFDIQMIPQLMLVKTPETDEKPKVAHDPASK